MTVAVVAGGLQTIDSIGSTVTLETLTVPGNFQLNIDTTPMVVGDQIEVRVYLIIRGMERLAYFADAVNAQFESLLSTPSFASPTSWRATITQTAGTPRTFPWEVWSTI